MDKLDDFIAVALATGRERNHNTIRINSTDVSGYTSCKLSHVEYRNGVLITADAHSVECFNRDLIYSIETSKESFND